jgi:restriction endonuclease S subunit
LLISTTRPYLGAFVIVPDEYDGCVCSSGFALCSGAAVDNLLIEFVSECLKSAAGLRQMERRMTGGLYPAITQDELEQIRIPLPPLSVQRQIVERVAARRAEIAKLKAEAKARADAAKADVEAMILGTKPVEYPGRDPCPPEECHPGDDR